MHRSVCFRLYTHCIVGVEDVRLGRIVDDDHFSNVSAQSAEVLRVYNVDKQY